MSENERREFVDELLDASLNRYSQVEPRAGLEGRLVASVPQRAQRFAWPRWAWIPAAATAAVLIAALAFYATRQNPVPSAPIVAQRPPAPTIVTPAPPPVATSAVASRPVIRREPVERVSAALPRLATFPARAPLSEQERLLLVFVQQTPKEQLMARQLGAAPIERLAIQPLTVPPLEIQEPTTKN